MLFIGTIWEKVTLHLSALPRDEDELPILRRQMHPAGNLLDAFLAFRQFGGKGRIMTLCGKDSSIARQLEPLQGIIALTDAPQPRRYLLRTEAGEEAVLFDSPSVVPVPELWRDALAAHQEEVLLDGEALLSVSRLGTLLTEHPPKALHFVPGDALCRIPPKVMAQLLSLHPVLHVTEEELQRFTREEDAAIAAAMVANLSENAVMVRLRDGDGWLHLEQEGAMIPARPDVPASAYSRAGSILAHLQQGVSLDQAARSALTEISHNEGA
ncbi:MAG: hypothetical protein Q4B32_07185 [Clostridia bacterium]|nr:hypothetical protein [Clostridia bacterium]